MKLIVPALGLAALLAGRPAYGQTALTDYVTQVGEVTFNDAATSYINIKACDDASGTNVTIRLEEMGTLSQVALYVGGQNDACEESDNRNGTSAVCFQADGNLQTVQTNSQIIVTVADLEASGKFDCDEVGSQQGSPLKLYSFRNADPGTGAPESLTWGVADVTLDVSAPAAPVVSNPGDQFGTSFTVSFPTSTDNLLRYELFQLPGCESGDGGATDATMVAGVTATAAADSIGATAAQLGLEEGDMTALFVRAIDQAENEGDLSMQGVCVTAVTTGGYCASSGDCGCSLTSVGLGRMLTKGGAAGLVFLCALLGWRRLR